MRKRFEQQLTIGMLPINKISFPPKDRHQLTPLLKGLQHIFVTPELNEQVFCLLESQITVGKKATGRPGMNLWEILVLTTTRLCLNIDYDFLCDLANNHEKLRCMLGVGRTDFQLGKQYNLQTIKDNIGLLDAATLDAINVLVVKAGHALIKKKSLTTRLP